MATIEENLKVVFRRVEFKSVTTV